ncbi:MAG: thioesterase family protein [Nitrososphaeria archaeon]|jgi:acyl-CoA thioester hydrolase
MVEFSVEFRVLFVETDANGVVHFTNYFRYCERAEEELFRAIGLEFPLYAKQNVWFPRVEAHCKYISPCKYPDHIRVRVRLEELKEKAYRLGFAIDNLTTGRRAAECYVVAVSTDIREGHAVPMPREYADALLSFFKEGRE